MQDVDWEFTHGDMHLFAAAVLLLANFSSAGNKPCPEFRPGQLYPWQIAEKMPGDNWAELEPDLDPAGKPLKCRVFRNNMDSETRMYLCQAIIADGRYTPVRKDGIAVAGTIKTSMFLPGPQRKREEERRRKAFFKNNPGERSSCYPR